MARLFGGWLTDRFGPRQVAIVAGVFYVFTTAGYLISPSLPVMMGVRLLNGMGFGLLGSSLVSGVMLTLPDARRAEGAGWFSVGISLAVGLGPWLALTLAATPTGMTGVFVAATIAASLALLLILVFREGLPTHPAPGEAPPPLALAIGCWATRSLTGSSRANRPVI